MPEIRVFVSWSGKESKRVAKRIKELLPGIVPNVKAFFSPEIRPGEEWARRISEVINQSQFALLCVTRGNLDSQWLNFEAGALWKASRGTPVCPLLLDLPVGKLRGPLKLFQAKRFRKGEFRDICEDLAKKTRMNPDQVGINFNAIWPKLEKDVLRELKRSRKR